MVAIENNSTVTVVANHANNWTILNMRMPGLQVVFPANLASACSILFTTYTVNLSIKLKCT